MHDRVWFAQRLGFWIWMIGGSLCAAATFGLLAGHHRDLGLQALGVIFAFTIGAYALLARRAGIEAAILIIWGLGFGTWFPAMIESLGPITRAWMSQLGAVDLQLTTRLPIPFAVIASGAITAALLHVLTRSARVVVQTLLLSLIVAGTPLVPAHQEGAVFAGIIAWHTAVAGSLFRWMIERVRGGAGMSCASCGLELRRLVRPACPGCGEDLTRSGRVVPKGFAPTLARSAAPAGKWF